MKIWIITNARLHATGGLAASALQNWQTARALAELGHDVLLWVAELDGDAPALMKARLGLEAPERLRVEAFRPRGAKGEKKSPLAGWAFRALNLQRAKRALGGWPDAVVTRSPHALSLLRGAAAGGPRLVLEYQYPEWTLLWRAWRKRNPAAPFAEQRKMLAHWQAAERDGVRLADGVLYAAQSHLNLLARIGFAGPTQWLPSGCQPPDGESNAASAPEFDFGYIGSLAPENGVESLLEAAALLGRGRILIQGGGEKKFIERLKARAAQPDLAGRAIFAEPVDFKEVRAIMRRCRIGVAPVSARCGCEKRQYASPLKLVEWLAAGVPAIATTVPSVAQLAKDGETALLVPPDDPQALAAAMGRLLDDAPLRNRLAAAGIELARSLSHPERARGIATFLETLVAAESRT